MTGLQLGLLAASLIVHREPWVLPVPPESKAQSQADCSGEDCTVTFSPNPPELRAGRILKMAWVANLPAVFLGALLRTVAVLINFPNPPGEPTEIAFSVIFVPLIWYRAGRWMDGLSVGGIVGESTQSRRKVMWTGLARVLVWFLFAVLLLSLLFESHRESIETRFVLVVAIVWAGAYLAGGFMGDRRRMAQLRAPADG